jgi:putative membrane protein
MQSITTATSPKRTPFYENRFLWLLATLFTACWLYGWFFNHNLENWIIENLLVIIFLPVLIFTSKWHRFSSLSYICFFLFLLLHCYGAFYAYTHNAFGEWLKVRYHLWRNPYDRIVHFSFGFLIAYPAREILLTCFKVPKRFSWLYPIEIAFTLGTIFEMIEWGVASCTDTATGDTYVATQGDVWDAHKDIAMAVLGAAACMLLLYFIKRGLNKNKQHLTAK